MNKQLFLSQLRIQLRGLPTSEIEEIITDYESYFAEAKANNITEQQAVENLGHPREIANDLQGKFDSSLGVNESSRNIIVIIGLVLFNVFFAFGLLLGALGLYVGLVVAVISFVLSPIFVLFSIAFQDGHLFELFVSFILIGIGLLAYPQLIKLGKVSYQLFRKYINWNMRMMKGEAQ